MSYDIIVYSIDLSMNRYLQSYREVFMKIIRKKATAFVLGVLALPFAVSAESLVTKAECDFTSVEAENPWGFKTAGAQLSVDTEDVAGNSTEKLIFGMTDQKGGRVATKKFDAVSGKIIAVSFDWYPGIVNDKGGCPQENGGEVRLTDSAAKTLFTLNHTNKANLSWFVGKNKAKELQFDNDKTWYEVNLSFDVVSSKMTGTITDKSTGVKEEISDTFSAFSGKLNQLSINGVRTSGNNITWTTYLDNVKIAVDPISDKSITSVAELPYKRVYVKSTTGDISSIGLAKTVSVELANGEKTEANIESWSADSAWNPNKDGVYAFTGKIKADDKVENDLGFSVKQYVYNRLEEPKTARNTEYLDRGASAITTDNGILVSWRLLADEYAKKIAFNVYRNGELLNSEPIATGNYLDANGKAGDTYSIETLNVAKKKAKKIGKSYETKALDKDYLSLKVQKPADGANVKGETFAYKMNDAIVGDLDGDGKYEIIVKWYPSNAIDSSQQALTAPTLFDAYKLDGTLLWRIDMGLNLTSGAHYNQIVVGDFNADGKSEVFLKTADGTTVYGTTNGVFDKNKVISVIGKAEDNGKYVKIDEEGGGVGHITGGPEYVTFFEGATGKAIDTMEYTFALGDVASWGDTWYNRSDRFNAGMGYLDGVKPSAILGRGYYERTTYAAYDLVKNKIVERWTFDSAKVGRGAGLGNHNLVIADVDNDGKDEIGAGCLTLDDDGSILYAMDGEMQRVEGSHGDAIHIGAFYPDVEGLFIFGPREVPAVASMELHDAATGETKLAYFAGVDAGRGCAANLTKEAGYEVWATAGKKVSDGGAVYDVYNNVVVQSRAGFPVNFKLYWDGDLLHELLDGADGKELNIYKFNEETKTCDITKTFDGTVSCNGTKATPTLCADILGDWREEVVVASEDSSELRIYMTSEPTKYRLYTLMHDAVYRNSVAWQQSAYNQPTCLGFYLGEDIANKVQNCALKVPNIKYTKHKK